MLDLYNEKGLALASDNSFQLILCPQLRSYLLFSPKDIGEMLRRLYNDFGKFSLYWDNGQGIMAFFHFSHRSEIDIQLLSELYVFLADLKVS